MKLIREVKNSEESNYSIYKTKSGAELIRYDTIHDMLWWDTEANNPHGIGMGVIDSSGGRTYMLNRLKLTKYKREIIEKVQSELERDEDFMKLIHKSMSEKRKKVPNKFGGQFNPVAYARQDDFMFKRNKPGDKKSTVDMAYQVGTFGGGGYGNGFKQIVKTVLMCQAMNISMNIDMFDSDTNAIDGRDGYVICNVCNSAEKLDYISLMIASHSQFFSGTLFNGYSASGKQRSIGTFLREDQIVGDLKHKYDIIGGNLLPSSNVGNGELVSKIIKIARK